MTKLTAEELTHMRDVLRNGDLTYDASILLSHITAVEAERDEALARLADKLRPDEVCFWYMHDNHTFTRLEGSTILDIVQRAAEVAATSKHGMLCSPALLLRGKDVGRVGPSVHFDSRDTIKLLAEWIAAASADTDIARLLAALK